MKYRWTECPKCRCEVTINYSDFPGGLSGSVRRWSRDRSINDGKQFRVGSADRAADGGFVAECPCGQRLDVPAKADAVSAEREADLRVVLGGVDSSS